MLPRRSDKENLGPHQREEAVFLFLRSASAGEEQCGMKKCGNAFTTCSPLLLVSSGQRFSVPLSGLTRKNKPNRRLAHDSAGIFFCAHTLSPTISLNAIADHSAIHCRHCKAKNQGRVTSGLPCPTGIFGQLRVRCRYLMR